MPGRGQHPGAVEPVPEHHALEGAVEAVEVGGEDVVGQCGALRPALGQQAPPAGVLPGVAREQHGRRRLGRAPGTHQPVAPIRHCAHQPRRLQDPEHPPGARRARAGRFSGTSVSGTSVSGTSVQPEGAAGLGQDRRQHREPVPAQHEIAEAVDRGQLRAVPVQHGGDLPGAPREARARPEPQCGQADGGRALLLGEGHVRSGLRCERLQVREAGRRFPGTSVRGRNGEGREPERDAERRGGRDAEAAHHPSPSGAAQSSRTVRAAPSTVSVAAAPARRPASRRTAISGSSSASTATISGRAGGRPASAKR